MIRIGVDFGGTKIEAAALDEQGRFVSRLRAPNPRQYQGAIDVARALVARVEHDAGVERAPVGFAIPGSLSPSTGKIRNANSTWLNGAALDLDLAEALSRPVRLENDANCLAFSEALDGSAAGAGVVFAAILGTGCGGGVAVDGHVVRGANAIAGEWGHTPLPWPTADEWPAETCWCGRQGCLETWISGTGFCSDYKRATGANETGVGIVERARRGETEAAASVDRYLDRLARALAVVVDVLDPDVIVLGGGMSNTARLYDDLPGSIARHVFADRFATPVVAALHGDSSGVRGAAWLWPLA